MFIHLHNHTHYSILNWLPKPKAYVKKAKALWMDAVAITDTANIHGCHELYEICHEEWIKAILGCEFYVVSKCQTIKYYQYKSSFYLSFCITKIQLIF